jgi:hypothetical protein
MVVSERLLDDPCDDFSAFIDRVHHIQARAGLRPGAAGAAPGRAGISAGAAVSTALLGANLASQRRRGYQHTTLTPEFGPDGYLHHLPFTNVPVADLWSLNAWMAQREQQHFVEFTSLTEKEPQK